MVKQKACLLLMLAVPAIGADESAKPQADKSRYTLFDPVPRDQMREMSTDRPDVTESAYTLDAGHFQVEMSLVDYVYDDTDSTSTMSVLPANFKVGVLNNLDLQFVVEPYIHQSASGDSADGFGATQIRGKLNLWGNDEGATALAVMPFVQFPTADEDIGGNDHVEGGVIVPFAASLPHDWSAAAMIEFDVLRDEANEGYGYAIVHTATTSHPIVGDLSGYVEYAGVAPIELGTTYLAFVGAGMTYGISPDIQLDGGIYFGLTDAADDFQTFIGLSIRH